MRFLVLRAAFFVRLRQDVAVQHGFNLIIGLSCLDTQVTNHWQMGWRLEKRPTDLCAVGGVVRD